LYLLFFNYCLLSLKTYYVQPL